VTATTATYVEYELPGVFVAEQDRRPVSSRDPRKAAETAPRQAFAFTFYDVVVATAYVDDEEVTTTSRSRSRSGRYFIDGEQFDAAGVEALPGDHHILLANMRGNGWEHVVRCRTGNFQPMQPGDEIVSTGGAA
jgi:hypothetical protein